MGGRRAFDSCLAALAVAFAACGGGPRSLAFAPNPVSETMAFPVATPLAAARPGSVNGSAPSATASSRAASREAALSRAAHHQKASTTAASLRPTPAGRARARAGAPSRAPSASASTSSTRTRAPSTAVLTPSARVRAPKIVRVDSAALEFAVTARLAHEPLTRAIARRTRNPAMAERAAWAVTREAGRNRVSPSLLAAVLLIENRQLDSAAVSSQGAIGMMQVMPIHAGSYGCGSADLTNVDANICHGARILHLYLVRSRSVSVALRRYNGCVRGANTPRCSRYPVRVLQTAARLRRDILASATEADRHVRM
jgi:soluble lytic murein transglycosylase-like protein